MPTESSNLIQFPAPNPSSDKEPTDEDLVPYVQRKLDEVREKNPDTKLTVEALLRRPVIREGFTKQFKDDQERKRAEEEAAIAAELDEVQAEFMPPPPPVLVVTPSKTVSTSKVVQSEEPEIPFQVERCRSRMVNLFPACVFEVPEAAAAMRFHLVRCIRNIQGLLKRYTHPWYVQLLQKRYDSCQHSIELINQVIVAWDKDPKNFYADHETIDHVGDLLDNEEFFGLLFVPSMDDAWQLKEKEEEKDRREQVLRPSIHNLLVQAGCTSGADKMADRLVRKYGDLDDAGAILRQAATDKMAEARNDDDKSGAKLYAKAGGMTEVELEKAMVEKNAQAPKSVLSTKQKKESQLKKKQARCEADNNARPKPNVGSGDIAKAFLNNKKQ